jgi:hypothetical protein
MTTIEKLEAIKSINKEIDELDTKLKNIDKGDYFEIAVEMDDYSLRELLAEHWRTKKESLFTNAEILMK